MTVLTRLAVFWWLALVGIATIIGAVLSSVYIESDWKYAALAAILIPPAILTAFQAGREINRQDRKSSFAAWPTSGIIEAYTRAYPARLSHYALIERTQTELLALGTTVVGLSRHPDRIIPKLVAGKRFLVLLPDPDKADIIEGIATFVESKDQLIADLLSTITAFKNIWASVGGQQLYVGLYSVLPMASILIVDRREAVVEFYTHDPVLANRLVLHVGEGDVLQQCWRELNSMSTAERTRYLRSVDDFDQTIDSVRNLRA